MSRLTRFNYSLRLLLNSVGKRKTELGTSFLIAMSLLLLTSILLYLVEGSSNPDDFGSIPRAMWWSIATLATVGYGDVTPLSLLGKFCAGITALIGIGIVAVRRQPLVRLISKLNKQMLMRIIKGRAQAPVAVCAAIIEDKIAEIPVQTHYNRG